MNRAVIVSGGKIEEEFAERVFRACEGATVIGVDRGTEYLYRRQIRPQYIVGDFDSVDPKIMDYYRGEKGVVIREFNPVKDETDTEIAIRLALAVRSSEILILGATGGRVDHLWANIQSLAIACGAGVPAYILDSRNKIYVVDKPCTIRRENAFGPYLSVFTLNGEIPDFNLTGTKWPLHRHLLKPTSSLTVSNRFQEDEVRIEFPWGLLVIMETRDE